MNLLEVNDWLVEQAEILEGRRPKSAGSSDAEGTWVTLGDGRRILIKDKKGKAASKDPGDDAETITPAQEKKKKKEKKDKAEEKKAGENLDKVMGDDTKGLGVTRDKNGKLALEHPDVPRKQELEGPGLLDMIAGMTAYIDIVSAIAMKGTLALGRKMEGLIGSMKNAIDEWQDSGK